MSAKFENGLLVILSSKLCNHKGHVRSVRMIGGHPVAVNSTEFAHHVSFGFYEKNMSRITVTCGGTLLTMRYFDSMN